MKKKQPEPVFPLCVTGYRQWQMHEWVLSPLSMQTGPWRPGQNHAKCHAETYSLPLTRKGQDRHACPGETCQCGLYAFHDVPGGPPYVTGAIVAWGDLRVHHYGFRAQHAQIVALAAHPDYSLAEVSMTYRVPIVPPDMLKVEAEKHGQPLPETLRPPVPEVTEQDLPFSNSVALRRRLYGSPSVAVSSKPLWLGPAFAAPPARPRRRARKG